MTKIINIYGSPSAGKSTLSAGLFQRMKLAGKKVELATEWIKEKVYEGATYPFVDELYTFAKQNKKLNQLVGKVDYVICDSPILLTVVYSTKEPQIFKQTVYEYYKQYDNMDFLLHRTHEFKEEGRVHNEKESLVVDNKLKILLDSLNIKYQELNSATALNDLCYLFKV